VAAKKVYRNRYEKYYNFPVKNSAKPVHPSAIRMCYGSEFWIRIRFNFHRLNSDPHLGMWIRIWIQEGKNGPQKKEKKIKKFHVLKGWILSFEDFSCSLDVLHGGLGINKLQFFEGKIEGFFQLENFTTFAHQNPVGIQMNIDLKCWICIRIRIKTTAELCGSTPLGGTIMFNFQNGSTLFGTSRTSFNP
jgi:hypothetical protein